MLGRMVSDEVVWHDAECGGYREDLPFWLSLADATGGPVVDVGAGTGRVALPLAAAGHDVIACDIDEALVDELQVRASEAGLETISAIACDACDLAGVQAGAGLIIMPMQTVQLLAGSRGRRAFLRAARAKLRPGGVLALAIADALAAFDGEADGLPGADEIEICGRRYVSQTVAITENDGQATIHRVRTTGDDRDGQHHSVALHLLSAAELETEARMVGFAVLARGHVDETRDYVGSTVVMLRA